MSESVLLDNNRFRCWLDSSYPKIKESYQAVFDAREILDPAHPCFTLPRTHSRKLIRNAKRFLPPPLNDEFPFFANEFFDIAMYTFPFFDFVIASHIYAESVLTFEIDFLGYKEHFVHAFKTAFVAWTFLEIKYNFGKGKITVKKRISDLWRRSETLKRFAGHHRLDIDFIDEEFVEAVVFFTCIFHDIGYLFMSFTTMEEKVKRVFPYYSGDATSAVIGGIDNVFINDSLLWLLYEDSYESDKAETGPDRYARDLKYQRNKLQNALFNNLNLNHSMAGALIVLHYLQKLKEAAPTAMDTKRILMFNIAAQAIFTHDLLLSIKKQLYRGPELVLNSKENPLPMLLIIADNLQSWGRPEYISTTHHPLSPGHPYDNMSLNFKMKDETIFEYDESTFPLTVFLNESKKGEYKNIREILGPWPGTMKEKPQFRIKRKSLDSLLKIVIRDF